MKVRLTTSRAALGMFQDAGEIIEVPNAEGKRLIAAGQAERVGASAATNDEPPARDEP